MSCGYWQGRGQKEIQIVTREGKERIITVTRTVEKIRIVRPDGTVEEHEKVIDSTKDEKSRETETARITRSLLTNYTAGIRYHIDSRPWEDSYGKTEIVVGRRMLEQFWLDAGIRTSTKQPEVSLGISMHW